MNKIVEITAITRITRTITAKMLLFLFLFFITIKQKVSIKTIWLPFRQVILTTK